MNAGDTLIIDEPGTSLDSHLWIVISNPAENSEEVLLVNFTKYRADKDHACIVEPGDHPFVVHRTCVEYRGAKTASAKELQALLDSHQISSHKPAGPDLLARIRAGVPKSRMRNEHVLLLTTQGLVDPDDCGF
jgi:hypothetical protein